MLRETLKQEIDTLSDGQLRQIAELVTTLKAQACQPSRADRFWQQATPVERAQNFRVWVAQLSNASVSLPDTAFDRGNIYD